MMWTTRTGNCEDRIIYIFFFFRLVEFCNNIEEEKINFTAYSFNLDGYQLAGDIKRLTTCIFFCNPKITKS